MPRDLESKKATLDRMAPLSKESPPADHQDPLPLHQTHDSDLLVEDKFKKMKDIHPYSLLLNQEDVDECDWLEHVAFDANEAASKEKLAYRLTTCGELCSGLFSSAYPTTSSPLGSLVRSRTFPSVDSADSDRKRVLMAHIIATKHSAETLTDASMEYPSDWRSKYQLSPSKGHDEDGETVCLHSLAVHPDLQRKGLGRTLLLSWIQRLKDSGPKRIALLCRDKYIPFYEKAGFKNLGPSKVTYGGGGWVDMVLEFGLELDDDF